MKEPKQTYIGSTNNLKRRLQEHNSGTSKPTSRYKPWRLVMYEAYNSEDDARERESKLKAHGNAKREFKNRSKRSLRNGAGFTMIELLMYISVMAIMLLAITTFTGLLFESRAKNQTIAEVNHQGMMAMRVISQVLRNADSITSPTTGNNATSATIDVINASDDPTIFDLSGGAIRIKEGTGSYLDLTNSRVSVSDLYFENLSRSGTEGVLHVSFTISHVNDSGRSEFDYSRNFSTSASLRP